MQLSRANLAGFSYFLAIARQRSFRLAGLELGVSAEPAKAAARKGVPDMESTRKAELKTTAGPAEYFTGKVTITGQFQRSEPSRVGGAIVHFEPGARTAWHRHPLDQTLIVTEGVGWTQVEGGVIH